MFLAIDRAGVRATRLQTTTMAAHPRREDAILPIRFFKTILKSNLEKLQIPNKFTNRYGGGLSNPVFMKPPDGTKWKVYWSKQNGEVWLEKGWKEFVGKYSLDQGHLVFFKYERTSEIEVFILDQSGREIDYPSEENDNLEHQSHDDVLDEWPEQTATQMSPRPHKKMRGEKATPTTLSMSLNWPKEARARELERRFISCNPFFTVFILPHKLESKLFIPDLEGYIENREKYVILQHGERSWKVKLLSGHRLGTGWPLFSRGAELQPGDVCIFELICRKKSVFKVHVFKS